MIVSYPVLFVLGALAVLLSKQVARKPYDPIKSFPAHFQSTSHHLGRQPAIFTPYLLHSGISSLFFRLRFPSFVRYFYASRIFLVERVSVLESWPNAVP